MTKILALVFIAFVVCVAGADELHFPENKSCVAWETSKRLLLVSDEKVFGLNCAVSFSVEKTGENRNLKISIPIDKFDSEQSSRDKEVFHILKGEQQPHIEILISGITVDQWKQALAGELKTIPAQLKIGGESFPFDLQLDWNQKDKISAVIYTTFSRFHIEPPTVAGGVIAKVRDDLKLHASFLVKDIAK